MTATKESAATQRRGRPRTLDMDIHVGRRLKTRRVCLGMSQERLAEEAGLSFQQIQKYERGHNRVSAGRLHQLAQILDAPVSFFFDDFDAGPTPRDPAEDLIVKRETLELVRAYYRISDRPRRRLYDLVKAMGRMEDR